MTKITDKKGREHDADAVIKAFLINKGRNKKERDELLAEYEYGKDMSAHVEYIINKHGITFKGEPAQKISQE